MRILWLLLLPLIACSAESRGGARATEVACNEISAFADALNDVGIVFDYEPSKSPAALAKSVDVVVAGHLTGRSSHNDGEVADDEYAVRWVAFELEVEERIKGDARTGDRFYVRVLYSALKKPAIRYGGVGARRIPAVVFANHVPNNPSHLSLGVEGLATACEGGKPIGRLGESPEWLAPSTLDQLIDAAGATG